MNILFILPYDTTYRYKTAFMPAISYEPLTLSTLAALVPEELNATITLVDEGVRKFDYSKQKYDIVGITSTTSGAPRAYELAAFFKKQGSYVLLGGHHVTLMPDEASAYADTIFTGSAECTFPLFFEDYKKGAPLKRYISTGVDTAKMPLPRRDLMPKKGYMSHPTIIADYGCPNHCKYCVIHSFWGNNGKRAVKDVIDEIKFLKKKSFLFLDPSPFSNKTYAKELLQALAELKIKWVGLAALDIVKDDELLDLLQQSGCIGLLTGFETFDSNNLADMNKHKNKISEYKDVIQKMHQRKISVLGTFMVGFDGDTLESLKKLPDLIDEIQVDVPRFAILTPYPNTPVFKELDSQGRILTRDWSRYDSIQCVYQPLHMSKDELEQAFINVWKECYTFKRIFRRFKAARQRKLTTLITNLGFRIYAGNSGLIRKANQEKLQK